MNIFRNVNSSFIQELREKFDVAGHSPLILPLSRDCSFYRFYDNLRIKLKPDKMPQDFLDAGATYKFYLDDGDVCLDIDFFNTKFSGSCSLVYY